MFKSNNVDDRRWYQRPVTYGIFVLALLVVYLLLPKSLFHSFRCGSIPGSTTTTRTNYQATNGFFIDNEVIVIGPAEQVNNIIGSLTPATATPGPNATPEPGVTPSVTPNASATPVRLTLVEGCDLSYLNTRKLEQTTSSPTPSPASTLQVTSTPPTPSPQTTLLASALPTQQAVSTATPQPQQVANSLYAQSNLTADQRKSLVMRLYEIPRDFGLTTEQVINRINADGNGKVLADPNFLTSLSDEDSGPCGQPYAGGGSPYAGGGSPYAGGGSPYAGPGLSSTDVSSQFMQQWAIDQHGMNLSSSSSFTGRNVRVGVFDTSPFRKNYWFPRIIPIAQPTSLSLAARNAIGPDPVTSNHGLFVAELIHAVAPDSKIELIRVLNDNGCGNLWEIDKALQDFTSRESALNGKLNKVVINLSLGVSIPDEDHADKAQKASGSQHVDWNILIDQLDKKIHVYSFENTLRNAHDLGAVIVAAAGNNSAPQPVMVTTAGNNSATPTPTPTPAAQEMQFPAKYLEVVGVAATTANGDRACYSNMGDVAAPGGNGGPADVTDSTGITHHYPCAARASTWDIELMPCSDMANCRYGVMSLLIVPDQSGKWKYVYGLWSGTSFSTPLVSGLAALSFEKIGGNTRQVECLIYRGAPVTPAPANPLGAGLINMDTSMNMNTTHCPP